MNIRHLSIPTLLIVPGIAIAQPRGDEPTVPYTVARGDTLVAIAARGLKMPGDYRIVQRQNRIADPRRIRTGTVLRIPRRLLRIEPVNARVIAVRGRASVNSRPAQINMDIARGAMIQTGPVSFVTAQLADGSMLTVPSDSRFRVIALDRIVLTGAVEKLFDLSNGRIEAQVRPLNGRSDRFEVQTPVSTAAVRGTRFRVTYSPDTGVAGAGVVEGHVAVASGAEAALLDAGKGVTVDQRQLGTPAALLPGPGLRNSDAIQDGPLVALDIDPVADAARYRAQIATDAGFIDIISEAEAAAPQISIADIADGSYFVRLTALQNGGLEGLPAVFTLERRRGDIDASVDTASQCPAQRCLQFRWLAQGEGKRSFRFQLRPGRDATPVIDEDNLTAQELVVTDLPAGTYYWRVENRGEADGKTFSRWSDYQELHVTRPGK